MQKILIDVDTGIDDSIALLYALYNKEFEIVGITTSCGNVDAFQAAKNTLGIIELSKTNQDIPVIVGANQPLTGSWDGCVALIHGDNGVGNVELSEGKRTARTDILAEDFIYEKAKEYGSDLKIITLGRMTNLALTLRKYPDFVKFGTPVVSMGGTVYMRGNVSPVVEANFGGDPVACDEVFYSGLDILVVGLDVTMKTRLRMDRVEAMSKYCADNKKDAVEYMKKALHYYMRGNRIQNYCIDDCPLHDPLAMIVALHPELVTVQKRKARIECEGKYCRGMVVTDLRERPFDAKEITFALDVDAPRVLNELFSVFWQ